MQLADFLMSTGSIKIMSYIKQLRPKNWLKNVFVFIPLIFALELLNVEKLMPTTMMFATFCLASSAVYIFNDIRDVENDRLHPVKSNRPIASGTIGIKAAVVFAVILTAAAFGLAFYVNALAMLVIALYVAENILYSAYLKHRPIFDCFCIATGFILRVYAGSFASGGGVSDWLFLTVVAMSLFMAFGKRRGEILKVSAANRRPVLEYYDLDFLNGMMFACAGLSVVFYALWAMNRGMYMIYTVPIIIFIVCKYLLILHENDSHGDPTSVILNSKALISACGAYALLTIVLLYVVGGV
jgi:4-hydroxybenzoate polyprenyltransferase